MKGTDFHTPTSFVYLEVSTHFITLHLQTSMCVVGIYVIDKCLFMHKFEKKGKT